MGDFEPLYIGAFLFILGLIYVPVILYTLFRYKLTGIGVLFILLSIGSYLLLGNYMVGVGYYLDENPTVGSSGYGFSELTLLTYPYIFMTLSVLLGKKEERF
ncbi:hypothetical protein [Planococcus shixiaomingii]|uniref:hypothetical protein n=1 Tax=Planococcus shixiaomingii TaxID=3058393 RepID=UPI0026269507|nr:hypothetical protein [Planococcus sp. N022]WKA56558.1 hypothetical protein QWY21_09485 [Planococcus sp. N022]